MKPLKKLLFTAFALTLSISMLGHGVQVRWNIVPSTGAIRVWIEHWHGNAAGSNVYSSFPLNVSYTNGGVTTNATYYGSGAVDNTAWYNLPDGGSSSSYLSGCSGFRGANRYNDWVYWDFNPPACNTPVSLTIISGPSFYTAEGCSNLYPVTINSNFNDNSGPAITANDITVAPNTANCDAVVSTYGVTAVDACGGAVSTSYSIPEGSTFSAGTTPVTVTSTDQFGNTSTKTFNVTVADVQAPTVVTQSATLNLQGGSANLDPSDVDNGSFDNACGGIASYSVSPNTFNCNNIGTNTVWLTVTDIYGNSATSSTTVTVSDNTAPSVSTKNISVSLDANSGMASISAGDINDGSADDCGIVSYSLDVSTFDCTNIGANTVTLTAADASNNISSATATVTVLDPTSYCNVAPVAVAQNITVGVGANCTATISAAQVDGGSSDADQDPLTLSIDNAGPFGVGTYSVTLTADDGQASSTDVATVTVVDNSNPSALVQNVTVVLDANGQASILTSGGSTVVFDGTFTGDANGTTSGSLTNWDITSGSVDVSPFISGSTQSIDLAGNSNGKIESNSNISLAPGTYELSFVYKNNDGSPSTANSFSASLGTAFSKSYTSAFNSGKVSVTETISVSAAETTKLIFEQTGSNDASGTFLADIVLKRITASGLMIENGSSDNCGIASLSASQVNFTCADLGANNVTLTATDIHGNTGTAVAVVTVVDNIDPVLSNVPGDIVVTPNPNDCSPAVTWTAPTASDNCSVTLSSSHNSGDNFSVGTTTVTYTATDAGGNSVSGNFLVTVTPTPVVVTSITSPTFIGGDHISCNGASDGSINITVDGGCEPYSYAWDNGSTSQNPSGLPAGQYTVTVTDANNQTTTATITLTEPAPVVASASSAGYLSGNGVTGSTLYLGYGPQSINLSASAVGGHGGYTYAWSNGMSGANVTVSPTVTTTYTVTVTDVNGCTDSEDVTVNVLDVRCAPGNSPNSNGRGNNGNGNGRQVTKVNVCHNGNTICIDSSAVASHLANHNHGNKSCYLGACGTSAKNATAIATALDMHIYPNPTKGIFNVQIHSDRDAEIKIVLTDIQGRIIAVRNDYAVNGVSEAQFDLSDYANGVYIVKVIGLGEQQVSRLIKE